MFDVYVRHHARLQPKAPAIIVPAGEIAFGRLDADVMRTAAMLRALDAGPDRPVAVAIDDFYLNWVVILALARLGVPSSPGNDRSCPVRISQRAGDDATLHIGEPEVTAMLNGPVPAFEIPEVAPDALGRILPSSGTTGTEKRIALSWRMIEASIRNVPVAYGTARGPWLMATGTHTILGFILTLGCWAVGNPVLMVENPAADPGQVLALQPSLLAMTPGQLGHFLDGMDGAHEGRPLRIVTGGGSVPRQVLARAQQLLGPDFRSVYGASECGAVAIASPELIAQVSGAAGYVLPGVTVQIIDDLGAVVPPGALGHVRIRSDRVAMGYCGGESDALRDGWFTPGDLGRLDTAGLLRLEGRADDLMNLGGQKVFPGWVEAAALACPGVLEAAAFSVADDEGWERCWIALVIDDQFSEAALTEALAGPLLAAEQISWFPVDRLPRSGMDKVDRNALRAYARTRPPVD